MFLYVPKREYFNIPVFINTSDLCVYAYLSEVAYDNAVQCSLKDIANHFRKSKHFASDAVQRLVRANMIKKEKGRGNYTVIALSRKEAN
ncbi:MarR family transcriptional regulator [Klebsiella pneumoniae]|uniref:MarR family transcriptional regulator n=2 Tax=Klebsiella africana TaxID=2489010 RepID=A0A8B6IWP8_9ENTR|nr:helix-turn-helix domain-containing protein [Klebsiella africana]EIX9113248.1 MarR family transcriptional regulator [Klebsiella pneumoniae]EJD3765209.1 MarR family transcriptional regulator [Klebsiella pneumoniae]MCJ4736976.1 MarR family transcriptional regulator [Klebsiella pneumoniae]UDD38280.1 MarR family transcriptional regulator [Klebsiella africana]VGQ08596.1 hypothetical protein SB5857_04157 [Klebsiella africana]